MVHFNPISITCLTNAPSAGPRLAPADVILVGSESLVVSFGVQQVEARMAVLDYDPSPGDRILVIGDEESGHYVIGVLATARPRPRLKIESSANSGATVLSVEHGDLEVVAARGAVRVISATGLDATTMGPINLKSRVGVCLSILDRLSQSLRRVSLTRRAVEVEHEQCDITAGRLQVTAQDGSIKAEDVRANLGSLSFMAQRVSSELGSLLTKVENAYHRVADLWQLAAKRTRMVVEETSHHKAQRIYSKADDVKVKAEQIHLG